MSSPAMESSVETAVGTAGRRIDNLEHQLLRLLGRGMRRAPYAVIPGCFVAAIIASPSIALWKSAVWLGAVVFLLLARRVYIAHALASNPSAAPTHLRAIAVITGIYGVVTGIACIWFFPELNNVQRALITAIMVCLSAGGATTSAAYPPAFYAYSIGSLVSVAWAWGAIAKDYPMVVLIGLFGLIGILFVRDNLRVLLESIEIRYENERLIEALERERQESSLARDHAEAANLAKSRFLAAASHDLRQPLHALTLYSSALSLRSLDPTSKELTGQIGKAIQSVSVLLDSMLNIARLDAGVVKPELSAVSIERLVDRIATDYRPVADAKGIAFETTPTTAQVWTDRLLLERLVRNLVDNAIKYTERGTVAIRVVPAGDRVQVEVADTGCGIPEAERERIFEEFYQVGNPERDPTRGIGVGLATVRRLADLLGATLSVESTEGAGSRFILSMPLLLDAVAEPTVPVAPRIEPALADLAGINVLVVDDDPSVRFGMWSLLERWGCKVTVSSGLADANDLLDRHGMPVDLIISDLRLRQNEFGIDTVARLRERLGPVPALLVTGDTGPELVERAETARLPLLHKPVPPGRLRQAIAKAIESKDDAARVAVPQLHLVR